MTAAWTLLGTLFAAFAVIVAWQQLRNDHFRRARLVVVSRSSPLLRTPNHGDDVKVSFRGIELRNPNHVLISINVPDRRDISSSAFDAEKPLVLHISTRILELLKVQLEKDGSPLPEVGFSGSDIFIGPSLLPARNLLVIRILVDADEVTVDSTSPLINVDVQLSSDQEYLDQNYTQIDSMLRFRRVLLGVLLVFAIYAVFAAPSQSAEVVGNAWDNVKLGCMQIFDFLGSLLGRKSG